MKGKNKFAKYAMIMSALAFAFGIFINSPLALIFTPLAIVLSIIALKNYNTNKEIGGKGVAIASLAVCGLVFLNFIVLFAINLLALQGSSILPDSCVDVYSPSRKECVDYSLDQNGILTFSFEHNENYSIIIKGLREFSQRDSRDCNNDLISINGNTTLPYAVASNSKVELKINCGLLVLQKDKMVGVVNVGFINLRDNHHYSSKFQIITAPSE